MFFLANESNVRSVLHEQVSLAAVNQISVIHEAMNGWKQNLKDSFKTCFKNVNINRWLKSSPACKELIYLH